MIATKTHRLALNFLLLIGILVIFVFHVVSQVPPLKFDHSIYQEEYQQALAGQGFMSDQDLYAWAGWNYIHGLSPDKINFTHPPLAKYIIGFSELVFGSQNLLSIVFGIVTLVFVYLITKRMLPTYFALVPPFLLSFDRLFLGVSTSALLEIYTAFFAVLCVLIFISFRRSKWLWIPLGVSIGLSVASKWTGLLIVPALFTFAVLKRDKRTLVSLALSLPVAALTYTTVYGGYFASGHSLQDFIALQLQMLDDQSHLRYGRGTPPPFWLLFNFISGIEGYGPSTLLFANWTTKTLDTISARSGIFTLGAYNPLTWPSSVITSVFVILHAWRHRNKEALLPALVFFAFVGATLQGQVFIWYLLPALPFGFISIGYVLSLAKSSWKPNRTNLFLGGYLFLVAVWSFYFALPSFIAIR